MKSSIFFTVLFVVFQIKFWVSEDGIFQLRKTNESIVAQQALNYQLEATNEQLAQRIALMQLQDHHPLFKEKQELVDDYARQKLGLIKSDEIFYYW